MRAVCERFARQNGQADAGKLPGSRGNFPIFAGPRKQASSSPVPLRAVLGRQGPGLASQARSRAVSTRRQVLERLPEAPKVGELDTVFLTNFKDPILIWSLRLCQLLGVLGQEQFPARWSCDDPSAAGRCSNVSIVMSYPFWQVYEAARANFNPALFGKEAVMSFNNDE
jgi:hypothetical protein